MSSTEARKSKTVIVMEKEKIYLSLNQFEKKVSILKLSFLPYLVLQSKFLHMLFVTNLKKSYRICWAFLGAYYGGYEGYGYGERPRGCADAWKGSSIWCITFAIY